MVIYYDVHAFVTLLLAVPWLIHLNIAMAFYEVGAVERRVFHCLFNFSLLKLNLRGGCLTLV